MKSLRFDSILLMILVIPFIMSYRISPFATQYWYFSIIFFFLLLYLLLDFIKTNEKVFNFRKDKVLILTIVIVIGGAFSSAVITRHKIHPIYQVHDIILQQEAAMRYFLDGKNPYKETYFGTFLEQWHYSDKEVNPALYHFVMEPFYLLFPLPFYFVSNRLIGYFDARIPLFLLFFGLLGFAYHLVKDFEKRRLFIILLAFHPAMLPYTLEGRSDIFMFTFLFLSLYLLHKKKMLLSGMFMAASFATKQSSWFIFPFYVFYIYFVLEKNVKYIFKSLLGFFLICSLIIFPFAVWDWKAFYDSTIGYLNGSIQHSYPISGYGFGSSLVELGIISNKFSYYPFIIWQLLFGFPVLLILLKFINKEKTLKSVIASYGIFLFIFWYFSRYFNNSHIAYISLIFLTAYFWPEEPSQITTDGGNRKDKTNH